MANYYKFLNKNRTSTFQVFQWPEIGEWLPAIKGDAVECEVGYHVFKRENPLNWIAPALYEVEVDGTVEDFSDKSATTGRIRLARHIENWNDRSALLFATDCAALVLHLFENKVPNDDRPRKAIEVARLFANGEATSDELDAAAGVAGAAGAAAWAAGTAPGVAGAARDAAWAAAWAAWAAGAAARVAGAAARAAWAAAGVAARDALTKRFWEYADGTAETLWELDNGERLAGILEQAK